MYNANAPTTIITNVKIWSGTGIILFRNINPKYIIITIIIINKIFI
uniref:Uncharacterized protein n=1 Tax=viral metagenome TaxID=1070528 RepID=A0A6C0HHH7_9ZZZZ